MSAWLPRRRRVLWASVFVALNVAVASGMSAYMAGTRLLSAAPASIPDSALGLPHESVTFPSASGSLIHGWWVPGAQGGGAVVLLHGIKGNRLDMVGRAQFLNRAGYSVLLFDFQAHGESPGPYVTLGYLEARDAAAAVAYAQGRRPGESVSLIGVSLGGAAALLGPAPLPVRALVLEAVYPRIQDAVKNRMRVHVGPLADLLAPLLFVQFKPRAGIAVEDLAPLDRIRTVTTPVLVITGSADRHTTLADSQALFDAAAGPKEMWVIPGAVHQNFAAYSPREYEAKVLAFLDRYRK
jgi:alpha-beta hydrolase superfamily lysophospholipase